MTVHVCACVVADRRQTFLASKDHARCPSSYPAWTWSMRESSSDHRLYVTLLNSLRYFTHLISLELSLIYNIVFTLKARYDLNCVKSTVKLQPTNQNCLWMSAWATVKTSRLSALHQRIVLIWFDLPCGRATSTASLPLVQFWHNHSLDMTTNSLRHATGMPQWISCHV